MKVHHLFEKTVKSTAPEQVKRQLFNMAIKYLYTQEEYDRSPASKRMPYKEWQIARFEKDFDVTIKDTDPWRIGVNRKGLIELGIKLGKINKLDPDQSQNWDLEEWLGALLKSAGWFLFRIRNKIVLLDPISQQAIEVPDKIYHVTASRNATRILKKGLLPSRGKYDDDFKYPARVHVYLTRDFVGMRELAYSIMNYGVSSEDAYYGADNSELVTIFEIDTTKLNKGTRFYTDISVQDGAWTYSHIPPEALTVVHED